MADRRRRRLKDWIDRHYGGNFSEFARRTGKPPTQIVETIRSDGRSFGAKLARELEQKVGMPRFYLDLDESDEPTRVNHESKVWTADIASKIENLTEEQQREIRYWVQGRIADFEREGPNAAEKKSVRVRKDPDRV